MSESAADESRIDTRAELLPEEQEAGSDDPHAQAEAILAESDARTDAPEETRHDSVQTPDAPEATPGYQAAAAAEAEAEQDS
ncbi:MAG: hypothetical protein JWM84_2844 [Nocardioides sp.]|nr:hypothetical protein [Nocardioides sp.]